MPRAYKDEASRERRRAYDRERQRELYKDPRWRANKNAARKRRRLKNLVEEREKSRARYYATAEKRNKRRRTWARKNRKRQNENSRRSYAANREKRLADITRGRIRRNPSHGLFKTINDFRSGRLGAGEFVARLSERVELCDQGPSRKSPTVRAKKNRTGASKSNGRPRKNSRRASKGPACNKK